LKLLVDEMYPSEIAEQLAGKGFDVVPVYRVPGLLGSKDKPLFDWAVANRRAVFTENARDFLPLIKAHAAEERDHYGLVLISPKKVHRSKNAVGALPDLLAEFLQSRPTETALLNQVNWL